MIFSFFSCGLELFAEVVMPEKAVETGWRGRDSSAAMSRMRDVRWAVKVTAWAWWVCGISYCMGNCRKVEYRGLVTFTQFLLVT